LEQIELHKEKILVSVNWNYLRLSDQYHGNVKKMIN